MGKLKFTRELVHLKLRSNSTWWNVQVIAVLKDREVKVDKAANVKKLFNNASKKLKFTNQLVQLKLMSNST